MSMRSDAALIVAGKTAREAKKQTALLEQIARQGPAQLPDAELLAECQRRGWEVRPDGRP